VLRTEDVWQRYNQFIEAFRSSQSGFPLLTPTMQAWQDSDAAVGGSEQMCTLHAVVVLCIVFVTMLPDRVDDSFTSTICLYLSPSQLNKTNEQFVQSYARAHAHAYPHTPTRIGPRTHIGIS